MYFHDGLGVCDTSVRRHLLKSVAALHGSQVSRIGAGQSSEMAEKAGRRKGDWFYQEEK